MTVTVVVDMTAAPGKGDELAALLRDQLYPLLRGADVGLRSIDQYRVVDEPDRVIEIETWDEAGQHTAWSEQAMADGTLTPVFPLLAGAPSISVLTHTGSL